MRILPPLPRTSSSPGPALHVVQPRSTSSWLRRPQPYSSSKTSRSRSAKRRRCPRAASADASTSAGAGRAAAGGGGAGRAGAGRVGGEHAALGEEAGRASAASRACAPAWPARSRGARGRRRRRAPSRRSSSPSGRSRPCEPLERAAPGRRRTSAAWPLTPRTSRARRKLPTRPCGIGRCGRGIVWRCRLVGVDSAWRQRALPSAHLALQRCAVRLPAQVRPARPAHCRRPARGTAWVASRPAPPHGRRSRYAPPGSTSSRPSISSRLSAAATSRQPAAPQLVGGCCRTAADHRRTASDVADSRAGAVGPARPARRPLRRVTRLTRAPGRHVRLEAEQPPSTSSAPTRRARRRRAAARAAPADSCRPASPGTASTSRPRSSAKPP